MHTHTHTSMPLVGFDTTIPMLEREKTVHALDRRATVFGFRLVNELISVDEVMQLQIWKRDGH